MKKLSPESSTKELSGVGPTKYALLSKIGLTKISDLVYNFPRMYQERGNILPLAYADTENSYGFLLTIGSEVKNVKLKRGLTLSKFRAFDETGTVEITFFNSPFVKDIFHLGSQFRFFGKISIEKNKLSLTNPQYEPYIEGKDLMPLVPVYPLTHGLNSKFIEKITREALDITLPYIVDPLPEAKRLEAKLCTLSYALKNVHFPDDSEALSRALRRLAFDEMLYFGLAIAQATKQKMNIDGVKFKPTDITPVLKLLPYTLTNGQKNAINDIYRDTVIGNNGKISPMARILVGDVGSGKTICSAIAMYISAKSNFQSALMVPTEILARQHYKDLSSLYSTLGIKVELLLGSTTSKEKERIYNAIDNGECDIVVGTHALLSDKFNFNNLGLIITDEQHRFGVNQRAVLKDKAKRAHMLVMSATPIPRTLALTMYGDLDVSRICELPSNRLRVDTYVVDENYRDRLNAFIEKQVSLGGLCYIVCPAIEGEDKGAENTISPLNLTEYTNINSKNLNLKNVIEYTDILKQKLPNINIACLHGKMKPKEKDKIMTAFSKGEIQVLVSTTVIEVGVNVPDATLMIIENAERFGLAQLHQLRGRVGRGNKKSYCILVNGGGNETSQSRLEIMRTTYDGFEIAEKDLILRGPGDFFTSVGDDTLRQSGGFEFKLAHLCNDNSLFELAFKCAKEIISEDPTLSLSKNLPLRCELLRYNIHNNSTIS